MRVLARRRAAIGAAGFALVLSACGGGEEDGGAGDGPGAEGGPTGAVTIVGCKPQNPLIPGNTQEVCGGDPLDAVFSKLVRYNPDTAAPENDVAESIESDDNVTWTVTLKDGWTFHDGTPITAESFVNAWNWNARGENAYLNAKFFEPIEGFTDVHGEVDADGAYVPGSATADEMSGLAVVDEKTFTIKLISPQASFPQRLGFVAYAPLPDVFYEDPDAFGAKPIGSGPFSVAAYNQDSDIQLTAYEDYAGDPKPKVKDVTFKIYSDANAGYNDLLADNVDVMTALPPSTLAGEQFKADLGDRYIQQPSSLFTFISFPPEDVDPSLSNIDLRRGLSKAIDRELIVQNIFQGTRTPATGWVSPVVDGYQADACGEWCTFDPEGAKELVEKAGGYEGTLTLSYNADRPNADWCAATCNSIRNATGIDCVPKPVVDFATFRDQITNREMTGMFRNAWQMDYPSIENYLVPQYTTGGSANDGDYSNPEFDAKIAEAASAATTEEANALYQEAEAMLAEGLPSIPLWYTDTVAGYSTNVDNVKMNPFGTTDLLSITAVQ